jgi:hypothetical protein
MPKKIGTTIVPRNPVARSPLLKKGGAHQVTKTTDRRNTRQAVKSQLEDWRDDLAFERSLMDESSCDELLFKNRLKFNLVPVIY